jgi:hypothetical protein
MTEEEEAFEYELAEVTEGGFFHQRRFGFPPLSQRFYTDTVPPRSEGHKRVREAAESIRGMLAEEQRAYGANELEVEKFQNDRMEYDKKVRHRQVAYAAWLVTDPLFRRERDILKKGWAATVNERHGFPDYPRSMVGESAFGSDESREQLEEYIRFLQRWGLDKFETWDLPVPMGMKVDHILYKIGSENTITDVRNGVGLNEAGLGVFLPWSMLRDDGISVRQLAEHSWRVDPPEHVRSWLRYRVNQDSNWNYGRYEKMMQIYRYLVLALQPRYGKKKTWRLTSFDRAITAFFQNTAGEVGDDENVRRIRQRLFKGLESD